MPDNVVRVAMWSGPRNISTAMMRSFGNRSDTVVCDEPLYSHYLRATSLPHPGADEVIAHHEADLDRVIDWLLGPLPLGKSVFYQKHMAHHLLEGMRTDWIDRLTNCFLIRHPREVITSLVEFIPRPTPRDTGFVQQLELFHRVRHSTGRVPPVIDARDVLENPTRVLGELCGRVGIPFSRDMLSWPPGRRPTDGVWAKHWYAKVEATNGFGQYRPKSEDVPDSLMPLLDECVSIYEELARHRLAP